VWRTQLECSALLGAKHEPPKAGPEAELVWLLQRQTAAQSAPPLPQRPPVPLGAALPRQPPPARVVPAQPSPRAVPPKLPSAPLPAGEAPLIFAFDLETTGLSSATERIIEMAVVDCETGATFSTLVNPGAAAHVPARVAALTRIHTRMVHAPGVPHFAAAAAAFEAHVAAACAARGHPRGAPVLLAAHNARSFDVRFLAAEYARARRTLPPDWRFVDTLPLARALVRNALSYKLTVLCTHFALDDADVAGAHRAAADAHMVRALLGPRALGGLKPDLAALLLRNAFLPL
jgi:DNA polymerase III epsilon subunit-like protein